MSKYKHLLSPGRIGTLEIRNRLLQTAMGSNLAEEGGFVGDALVAYHEARAAGGIGLIITEAIAVGHPQGTVLVNQVGISDDKFIPGLKRMTDAAHRHGAKMAAQLHFGGIMAAKDMVDGRDVWVPSMPQPSSAVAATTATPAAHGPDRRANRRTRRGAGRMPSSWMMLEWGLIRRIAS